MGVDADQADDLTTRPPPGNDISAFAMCAATRQNSSRDVSQTLPVFGSFLR